MAEYALGVPYGTVSVRNNDGSINREFRVSAEEVSRGGKVRGEYTGDQKHDDDEVLRIAPPGLTVEEVREGRYVLIGKPVDVGQAVTLENGRLLAKHAERVDKGRIVETYLVFDKGEWSANVERFVVDDAVVEKALSAKRET